MCPQPYPQRRVLAGQCNIYEDCQEEQKAPQRPLYSQKPKTGPKRRRGHGRRSGDLHNPDHSAKEKE